MITDHWRNEHLTISPKNPSLPIQSSWKSSIGYFLEHEVVLNREGGDPKVVGRDGDPFFAELLVKLRGVMGGLLVRQEDGDAGAAEESLEIGGG